MSASTPTAAVAPLTEETLGQATDEDLAMLTQAHPEAFGEIVRRHQSFVFGAALRVVRDPVLAEDLAQEAFLRAFRKIDSFRGESDLRGWLYRIARNAAMNAVTRRREFPEAHLPEEVSGVTPETHLLRRHTIDRVRAAIADLPEALRTPLILHEFHDTPYAEIADMLGIPLNTVRTRIHRAKRAIESSLGGSI